MGYYVITKLAKWNTKNYEKFKRKGIQYASHWEPTLKQAIKSANTFKRKGIKTRIYKKLPKGKLKF